MPEYQRIEDIDPSKLKLACLTYGEAGTGKTWFAGTFPNPCFICTEDGLIGLRLAKVKGSYVLVKDFSGIITAIADVAQGRHQCKTIVLDSLTEVTPLVIESVLTEVGKTRMDINSWGLAVDKLRMVVKELTSLRRSHHVVVIGREQIVRDELTGSVRAMVDTIGRFATQVPGHFDLYLHCKAEVEMVEGVRKKRFDMWTVDFGNAPAKDRTGKLDVIEPNDYKIISQKVYGGLNA